MDFVAIAVITDIDNWFGSAFEAILETYYKEDTLDHSKYLEFETTNTNKVSVLWYIVINFILTIISNVEVIFYYKQKVCPKL